MNTKELAVSLGLARARRNRSPSPLPTVPHSQTWSLSQEANKKYETCRVCFATRQQHMKDGTVHNHGPRNKPCSGSHQPPLSDSVQYDNQHRLRLRQRQDPLLQKTQPEHLSCCLCLSRALRLLVIRFATIAACSGGFRRVPVQLLPVCC